MCVCFLVQIRKAAANLMGMQNLPKFAALGAPDVEGDELSINVRYFTAFGDMHYALAMTAGMCIGGACRTKGTIAEKFVRKGGAAGSQSEIKIGNHRNPDRKSSKPKLKSRLRRHQNRI